MSTGSQLLVLCANLKRRKDRRFVMARTLPRVCGSSLVFLDAIDGEVIPARKLKGKPEGMTRSTYAVSLTKRIALRRFLQSQSDYLLYLEDDVVVSEDFDEWVAEAMTKAHEVVFLGGGHVHPPFGDGRWRRCRQTYNNHALLFSRKGARKMLRIWGRWSEVSSDNGLQQATLNGRIDAWSAHPWVAFQRETRSDNWGNGDVVKITRFEGMFMQPDDLAVLDAAVTPSSTVLEYGSGHSTLHLAERLKGQGRLISIEHNPDWFGKTQTKLRFHGLTAECHLRPPQPYHEEDGPWRYLPGQMDDYVAASLEIVEEESIDVLFIDGRERIRCALTAAKLLRPGGLMLIHDFWGRMRYRVKLPVLLEKYEYLFESPGRPGSDPQGMAVFRRLK